jgi:hypothetical protein
MRVRQRDRVRIPMRWSSVSLPLTHNGRRFTLRPWTLLIFWEHGRFARMMVRRDQRRAGRPVALFTQISPLSP